ACAPVVMTWPPYWLIAAAFAAGSSLIAGLVAGGNTIFWAASWVCTSVLTTECPHSSSPPPTASTTASTTPAMVASASKVLLRISGASLAAAGPQSGSRFSVALTLPWAGAGPAGPQVRPARDLRPGPAGLQPVRRLAGAAPGSG